MFFRVIPTTNAIIEVMLPLEGTPDIFVLPEVFGGIRGYAPLLQALVAQGFRPAGINPRSCGASTGPLEGITLADIANDVAEVVSALAEPPVLVAGHAGGQRVGRIVASRRPELVSGVVLMAAGGRVRGVPDAHAALERAADVRVPLADRQAAWNRFMFGVSGPVPSHLTKWGDRSSELVAALRKAGAASSSSDAWWAGGSAPMLVIQGLDDEIAPVANGHMLAAEFPDRVTVIDLEGAAHGLVHQQPERIAAEIAAWGRL